MNFSPKTEFKRKETMPPLFKQGDETDKSKKGTPSLIELLAKEKKAETVDFSNVKESISPASPKDNMKDSKNKTTPQHPVYQQDQLYKRWRACDVHQPSAPPSAMASSNVIRSNDEPRTPEQK